MANNFRQHGDYLTVQTTEEVKAGRVYGKNNLWGVAETDAPAGGLVTLNLRGIYEFDLVDSEAVDFGDFAYWDKSNNKVTKTKGTHALIGVFVKEVSAGTNKKALVRLGN